MIYLTALHLELSYICVLIVLLLLLVFVYTVINKGTDEVHSCLLRYNCMGCTLKETQLIYIVLICTFSGFIWYNQVLKGKMIVL